MNETLKRIKARVDQAVETRMTEAEKQAEMVRKRAAAAVPLFQAFKDVRHQLVKVSVLKSIWPEDFHNRDDHATVLVADILGDRRTPYGIRLHIPGGFRRFEVDVLSDGSLDYVAVRESLGGRPHVANFNSVEQWLDTFYITMGTLLELSYPGGDHRLGRS
jgi:hypothetical protein